jgi:hypothetical protein
VGAPSLCNAAQIRLVVFVARTANVIATGHAGSGAS